MLLLFEQKPQCFPKANQVCLLPKPNQIVRVLHKSSMPFTVTLQRPCCFGNGAICRSSCYNAMFSFHGIHVDAPWHQCVSIGKPLGFDLFSHFVFVKSHSLKKKKAFWNTEWHLNKDNPLCKVKRTINLKKKYCANYLYFTAKHHFNSYFLAMTSFQVWE